MSNKQYLGITIGPIYRTFEKARRTREFWAASYFFSNLAKAILDKVLAGRTDAATLDKILLPRLKAAAQLPKDVGIYPDHLIFEADLLQDTTPTTLIEEVLREQATAIADDLKVPTERVLAELQHYLRIFYTTASPEHPILGITPLLDTLELQPMFPSSVSRNSTYLTKYLGLPKRSGGLLAKAGLERFDSLVEIATQGLAEKHPATYKSLKDKLVRDKNDDYDENEFLKELKKKFEQDFKNHHKYIAVIKGDGDGIGNYLKNLTNITQIQRFSEKLSEWGLKAVETVRKYGGKTIYAGGDDILIFAPVTTINNNVLNLLGQLRADWEKVMKYDSDKTNDSNPSSTSVSFGVSITYYKYPMIEAINRAGDLLYQLKQTNTPGMAIGFVKHSGAELPVKLPYCKLEKSTDENKGAFMILSEAMPQVANDKAYVNAVGYKIRENKAIFFQIASNATDKELTAEAGLVACGSVAAKIASGKELTERLTQVFVNYFDYKSESKKREQVYLEAIKGLVEEALCTYKLSSEADEDKLRGKAAKSFENDIFSAIRLLQFIHGLDQVK